MRNLITKQRGLSLIEVIVSIAILGILIIPIFSLLNINLKMNRISRDKFIANNIGTSEIEQLKFLNDEGIGRKTYYKKGFTINSVKEIVDRKDIDEHDEEQKVGLNDIYKIVVEIKKDDRIIESLFTYQSALKDGE